MTLPTDLIDYSSLHQGDIEEGFLPESFPAMKAKVKSLERYEEKQWGKYVSEQNIPSVSLQNTFSSNLVKSEAEKSPAEPAVSWFDSTNFTSRYVSFNTYAFAFITVIGFCSCMIQLGFHKCQGSDKKINDLSREDRGCYYTCVFVSFLMQIFEIVYVLISHTASHAQGIGNYLKVFIVILIPVAGFIFSTVIFCYKDQVFMTEGVGSMHIVELVVVLLFEYEK